MPPRMEVAHGRVATVSEKAKKRRKRKKKGEDAKLACGRQREGER
jgi:hypothetical protein